MYRHGERVRVIWARVPRDEEFVGMAGTIDRTDDEDIEGEYVNLDKLKPGRFKGDLYFAWNDEIRPLGGLEMLAECVDD